MIRVDEEEVKRAFRLLTVPGEIHELRMLNCGQHGVVSGYFDNPEQLAEIVKGVSGQARGVYMTLNPVDPHKLGEVGLQPNDFSLNAKSTSRGSDILRRRWLLVDVDPTRPAGVCATGAEKAEAEKVMTSVREYLTGTDWPIPYIVDSGNGLQLRYRVDIPNDQEAGKLVKSCLEALDRFSTSSAHIDTVVHDPNRIARLPGTLNCKGKNTRERPYRLSRILNPEGEVGTVTLQQLQALAASNPKTAFKQSPTQPPQRGSESSSDEGPRTVESFDPNHLFRFFRIIGHWEGKWFIVDLCPVAGHRHEQSTKTGFYWDPDSRVFGWHCFADSCKGSSMTIGQVVSFLVQKTGKRYPKRIWPKAPANLSASAEIGDDGGSDGNSGAADSGLIDMTSFEYRLDDTGNGERLVRQFDENVRWVAEKRMWMAWGKEGWHRDDSGELMRATKEVITAIRAESSEWWEKYLELSEQGDKVATEEAEAKAKALASHATKSARLERRKAMLELASFEKGVHTNLREWDADGWLLNVRNGIVDLRTQAFMERTRGHMCMKQAPVAYDPEAKCPLWEAAMLKWMCGDEELARYLQAALGITLTSDTSDQCFFFLEGGGENGKDTFLSTIQKHVLGDAGGYAKSVGVMSLMDTKWGHSEHRNDLAALAGATRMVTAAETQAGHHWDEAIIKDLTGGMTSITCRELYGKPFSFVPQFKLWVMSNDSPVIKGSDWGIWRRIKRIPWNYDFSRNPGEKDPGFAEKLRAEAPGILNWMLAGLRIWQENGQRLPKCKAVDDSTKEYRQEMDIMGRFASERLAFEPWASTLKQHVFKEFESWCKDNGHHPGSSRRFYSEFLKRFPQASESPARTNAGYHLLGVRLSSEEPLPMIPDDDASWAAEGAVQ